METEKQREERLALEELKRAATQEESSNKPEGNVINFPAGESAADEPEEETAPPKVDRCRRCNLFFPVDELALSLRKKKLLKAKKVLMCVFCIEPDDKHPEATKGITAAQVQGAQETVGFQFPKEWTEKEKKLCKMMMGMQPASARGMWKVFGHMFGFAHECPVKDCYIVASVAGPCAFHGAKMALATMKTKIFRYEAEIQAFGSEESVWINGIIGALDEGSAQQVLLDSAGEDGYVSRHRLSEIPLGESYEFIWDQPGRNPIWEEAGLAHTVVEPQTPIVNPLTEPEVDPLTEPEVVNCIHDVEAEVAE